MQTQIKRQRKKGNADRERERVRKRCEEQNSTVKPEEARSQKSEVKSIIYEV
jgi:hypothetical protein